MNTASSLSLTSNERFTFERFRAADKDRLLRLLTSDGSIWIHGDRATGKTHLAYASVSQSDNALLVADSTYDLDGCETFDLLVLDDFEAWLGAKDRETQLYSLYEGIRSHGGRLIVTASRAPHNVDFVLPDLATRMRSLERIELGFLDDQQKMSLLQERAQDRGMDLNDRVVHFLISRLDRSHLSLIEALKKLDAASLAEQKKITIPFVKTVLEL